MFLLVVSTVVAIAPSSSYTVFCKDSDNGDNPAVKGTIEVQFVGDSNERRTDYCGDFNHLKEYSCNSRTPATPMDRACKGGCIKGACVNSPAKLLQAFSSYKKDVPYGMKKKQDLTVKIEEVKRDRIVHPSSIKKVDINGGFVTDLKKCSETDAGDEDKKGKITLDYAREKVYAEFEDYCVGLEYVAEYSCLNKIPERPSIRRCTYVCNKGECISSVAGIVDQRFRTTAGR